MTKNCIFFSFFIQFQEKSFQRLLKFFANESCGQCTPCRLGCEKMVTLLTDATLDEHLLSELSTVMRDASICGLGQAAPNPVATGMAHFRDEFK